MINFNRSCLAFSTFKRLKFYVVNKKRYWINVNDKVLSMCNSIMSISWYLFDCKRYFFYIDDVYTVEQWCLIPIWKYMSIQNSIWTFIIFHKTKLTSTVFTPEYWNDLIKTVWYGPAFWFSKTRCSHSIGKQSSKHIIRDRIKTS